MQWLRGISARCDFVHTFDSRNPTTDKRLLFQILRDNPFTSLTAIYGLVVAPEQEDRVPDLASIAPALRRLELDWTSDPDDGGDFADSFSLPTSLEELDVMVDDGANGNDFLKRFLETGELASDGSRVKR